MLDCVWMLFALSDDTVKHGDKSNQMFLMTGKSRTLVVDTLDVVGGYPLAKANYA